MDVLNENPLAVLHLLCALVAIVSGLTVRLFGWRGRPPGGAAGVRKRSAVGQGRRAGRLATLRLFAQSLAPSMAGLRGVVFTERCDGESPCYLRHA